MPPPNAELERALAAARWEAHLTGRAQVDSAHLLLGLLHLPQSRAVQPLRALGVEPRWDRLRGPVSDAEAWPPPPDAAAPSVPHSRARRSGCWIWRETRPGSRGRETYGLTDLVIGLLSETQGLGCLLPRAHGLTAEKARRAFDDLD